MEHQSIRLEIPHPGEPNSVLVGILEQAHGRGGKDSSEGKVWQKEAGREGKEKRNIALILHGVAGHKDYLYQKRLASRLPMDSFRFDFRGNHESSGRWSSSGMENDVEDLRTVVAFLSQTYGYHVDLVIAHSRGSLVGFRWMCTLTLAEGERFPSGYVNLSARYRMKDTYNSSNVQLFRKSFKEQGFHIWTPTVAGKVVQYKIIPEDLDRYMNWDTSLVWNNFPQDTDVLTLHGLKDLNVPPYEAVIYSRALGSRAPGTHSLHLVENADHNYTRQQDEVIGAILDWWERKRANTLTTGVWMTGVKGKL
ncbi:hypothetical protein PM082_017874 [Marasmius tenuissimus]|nr:hypothetical protein PM082_017874 [Marasmius tenuissimus]